MKSRRFATLAAMLFAAMGCSSDGEEAEPSTGPTFLAFATHFRGYKSWEKFPVVDGVVTNDVHTAGPRTEYVNKRPAKGSTAFDVGTIIVKEIEVGAEADRKVFAMVKRGGDYNSSGARGWEWFELKNEAEGAVTIRWRGLGPPNGESYGGDPTGGCNTCHGSSRDNDFVQSPALHLSKL